MRGDNLHSWNIGRRGLAVSLLGALLATAMAAPAYAAAASSGATVEELIITAQKREESLQNVAISVTAIGAKTLQDFKIETFKDYATLVPGLTNAFVTEQRGVPVIGLRGVESLNGTFIGGQNTVGFYIDNSPIPVMDPHLTDVERIEVLRGPQGTLYGSSSLAGTIKIIPQKPRFDAVGGSFSESLSSTEHGGLNDTTEGVVNLPINSRAALRLSGYYDRQSGYVDFVGITFAGVPTGVVIKDANHDESYGGRAALLVNLTDKLSVQGSLMYHHAALGSSPQFMPSLGFVQKRFNPTPAHDDFTFGDVQVDWDLGNVELVSSTSYFRSHDDTLDDGQTASFSPLILGNPVLPATTFDNNREWTHETRLVSKWQGRLQGVVGVFYTDRKNPFGFFLGAKGAPGLLGLTTAPFRIPNDTLFSNDSVRNRREAAVFGEATFAVTDMLSLTAGLRAFDFKFTTNDIFMGPGLLVDGERFTRAAEAKDNGVVPRFRVELKPTDDKLLYASASKGFRMGGANYPLPNTPACAASLQAFFGQPNVPPTFASDSLWSYETGAKTTWLDKRLSVNVSAYHIDWSNTQVPVALTVGTCPFNGLTTNVGGVKSDGFELETALAPMKGLSINFNVAHMHTRVSEQLKFPGATFAVAPKGAELPNIPEWTAAVLAQYTFSLSDDMDAFVRGDYRYSSSRKASINLATNPAVKDPYNIVNLRIGVTRGPWEASLFAENLTDDQPSYLGQPTPASLKIRGLAIDETERPRTVGMALRRSF
jgi:iron complex outermembrane receptor protein